MKEQRRHMRSFILGKYHCQSEKQLWNIRQHSLYSLVHESRQGFFSHVGGKKMKIKFLSQNFFLSDIFWQILPIFWHKYYRYGRKNSILFDMSEEKIKKTLECQFFVLDGHILSSSEETWTKEYSECSLNCLDWRGQGARGKIVKGAGSTDPTNRLIQYWSR